MLGRIWAGVGRDGAARRGPSWGLTRYASLATHAEQRTSSRVIRGGPHFSLSKLLGAPRDIAGKGPVRSSTVAARVEVVGSRGGSHLRAAFFAKSRRCLRDWQKR